MYSSSLADFQNITVMSNLPESKDRKLDVIFLARNTGEVQFVLRKNIHGKKPRLDDGGTIKPNLPKGMTVDQAIPVVLPEHKLAMVYVCEDKQRQRKIAVQNCGMRSIKSGANVAFERQGEPWYPENFPKELADLRVRGRFYCVRDSIYFHRDAQFPSRSASPSLYILNLHTHKITELDVGCNIRNGLVSGNRFIVQHDLGCRLIELNPTWHLEFDNVLGRLIPHHDVHPLIKGYAGWNRNLVSVEKDADIWLLPPPSTDRSLALVHEEPIAAQARVSREAHRGRLSEAPAPDRKESKRSPAAAANRNVEPPPDRETPVPEDRRVEAPQGQRAPVPADRVVAGPQNQAATVPANQDVIPQNREQLAPATSVAALPSVGIFDAKRNATGAHSSERKQEVKLGDEEWFAQWKRKALELLRQTPALIPNAPPNNEIKRFFDNLSRMSWNNIPQAYSEGFRNEIRHHFRNLSENPSIPEASRDRFFKLIVELGTNIGGR